MRSSMNLNKNLRTEQFAIDVCGEVTELYTSWFDGLWDEAGRSQDNRAIIRAVYDRFLVDADEVTTRKRPAPLAKAKAAKAPKESDVEFSVDELSDTPVSAEAW